MTFADVQVAEPAALLVAIEAQLREMSTASSRPCIVMLSGLPGTGKSYFARLLVSVMGAALISTDHVRRTFFPRPAYSIEEGGTVYALCATLAEDLLLQGYPVVIDGTHLREWQRRRIYDLAERRAIPLLIVSVTAPAEVALTRLGRRAEAIHDPFDMSAANTPATYERQRAAVEPITRPHLTVDTSGDLDAALGLILEAVEKL